MKLIPIQAATLTGDLDDSQFILGTVLSVTPIHDATGRYWLLLGYADNRVACLGGQHTILPRSGQQVRMVLTSSDRHNPCLEIKTWQRLPQHLPRSLLTRLYERCPDPSLLDRLWQVVASIPHSTLRRWLLGILAEADFSMPFVHLSASFNHHHAEAGGLLRHSLECAEWAGTLAKTTLPTAEAAIVMAAALLHDAGKVSARQSRHMPTVPHEVSTLTVLEPALRRLDKPWPQGAAALRQILAWPLTRETFPKLPGSLLVRLADQYSTALSARVLAFTTAPENYQWARLKTPTCNQTFNRVLNPDEVAYAQP